MDQNTTPEGLPAGVEIKPMAQWTWTPSQGGRENAYLLGHPGKPGPYIYATRWPPHSKALAHTASRFPLCDGAAGRALYRLRRPL